ncbi:T9SS C-terminal target domain-containing protein [Dysgonomonas sp. 216]|uniref:T9SS type A sorting domain-containing protein n=1 Tax=Dysgonomonas sp. 216 TaxID=2302934 RepID=UPI0013CF575C|nr:T9SS type A sorting domain-containing protein [Dysgonomonas sp. 216]NDW19296.1 T9SS C-terminal target domain-containing protein [Dysgonomonas sp. 216]
MKKIIILCFFTFCIQISIQAQSVIRNFGLFEYECSDSEIVWDIDVVTTGHLFLMLYVDIQEYWDGIYVYSIDNLGNAVLQTTLTGNDTGIIRSLYPNGKMRIVFLPEYPEYRDENFWGLIEIGVYENKKISYSYDASGNRIGRSIVLETSPGLRSAAFDRESQEETVYEETFEYQIDNELQDANILIYPNPTHGQLAVEINNVPQEMVGEVYLIKGNNQLISKKTIRADQKTEFDLTTQNPGVYLLNIKIGNSISTWKIIKH